MFLRIDAGLTLDCRLTSFTIRRNDPVTPPRRRPHLAIKTREAQSYPPRRRRNVFLTLPGQ